MEMTKAFESDLGRYHMLAIIRQTLAFPIFIEVLSSQCWW